jgi:hypothetical protein
VIRIRRCAPRSEGVSRGEAVGSRLGSGASVLNPTTASPMSANSVVPVDLARVSTKPVGCGGDPSGGGEGQRLGRSSGEKNLQRSTLERVWESLMCRCEK